MRRIAIGRSDAAATWRWKCLPASIAAASRTPPRAALAAAARITRPGGTAPPR
ncbi:MAG TPA: hypothetical protein VEY92_01315 [Pseudoxanthomonas sp.]|nr:hypothetical protein [Pseudoxanthomonas sp.]